MPTAADMPELLVPAACLTANAAEIHSPRILLACVVLLQMLATVFLLLHATPTHQLPHAAALLKSSLQSLLVQTPANKDKPAQPVSSSSLTALLLLLLELLPSCPWCNVIQIIHSLKQVHPVAACNIQQPLHSQQLKYHRHSTCCADTSCCCC